MCGACGFEVWGPRAVTNSQREREEKMPAAGAEDSGTYLFYVFVVWRADRQGGLELYPLWAAIRLWRWSWAAQSLKPARWVSMGWSGPRIVFVVVIVEWLRSYARPSEASGCLLSVSVESGGDGDLLSESGYHPN